MRWEKILKDILSKKFVANILVLIAIAVMALIVSGDMLNKSVKNSSKDPQQIYNQNVVAQPSSEEEIIEERLKKILQQIKGVGEVEVMITFEMGGTIVPAINTVESRDTTEEKDSNGGVRTILSHNITENVAVTNDSSGNHPIVLKEIKPQINGVIVVAEGAEDIEVKVQLYEAVKTVLQVPGHRVQIYPKN